MVVKCHLLSLKWCAFIRNEWAEESEAVVPKVANGVVPEEKG